MSGAFGTEPGSMDIEPPEASEGTELADAMEKLSFDFDTLCQERHIAGAKEYGTFTFLENDVVRMMAEELADTANYCRMQFVKLMLLWAAVSEDPRLKELADGKEEITIGIGQFKGTGDKGWNSL